MLCLLVLRVQAMCFIVGCFGKARLSVGLFTIVLKIDTTIEPYKVMIYYQSPTL